MLAPLRRSRALALSLVLLAPGISGSAVQWLHACPVNSSAAAADHQHGSNHSDSGQAPACQCIGACAAAGILSPARAVTVVVAVSQPDRVVAPPSGSSFILVGTPSDLLPPATAPPA